MPSTLFEAKALEKMYIDLLDKYGIKVQSHVSRFTETLLERNADLEKRNVGKEVLIFIKKTADAYFKEFADEPSLFFKTVRDVVIPLRKAMESVNNKYEGCFSNDCQMKSVPTELLSLVRLLIDGLNMDNDHFSQATLTISQLLVSNFKKKEYWTGIASKKPL